MRVTICLLFAIAAAGVLGGEQASAAPSTGAVCKAATAASLISKAHCRVVRRCGYFGCSYDEVCT
jgi:hypothetical protein